MTSHAKLLQLISGGDEARAAVVLRLHSSIGHVPPIEYEQHYRDATTVTSIPDVA